MKTRKILGALSLFITLSAFNVIGSLNWEISDGYSIKFSGTMVSGIFKKMTGVIDFDPSDVSKAKIDLTIQANSIDTDNSMMNEHAVSSDWFDVAKYPTIQFVSTKVTKTTTGFVATGNMTIHGVTKVVSIPFNFQNNIFSSQFQVTRADYGVGSSTGMAGRAAAVLDIDVKVPVKKK